MSYMTMLRSEAFREMPAAGWRFESAAVTTPQLAKARGYAQNWDEFKKAGIGPVSYTHLCPDRFPIQPRKIVLGGFQRGFHFRTPLLIRQRDLFC